MRTRSKESRRAGDNGWFKGWFHRVAINIGVEKLEKVHYHVIETAQSMITTDFIIVVVSRSKQHSVKGHNDRPSVSHRKAAAKRDSFKR